MPSPAATPTLADLVAEHVLDAELAALAWLLLEQGVPVLVAGSDVPAGRTLLDALVAALPGDRRPLAAAERGAAAVHVAGVEHEAGAAEPEATGRLVRVPGVLAADAAPGALRAALASTTGRSGLAAQLSAAALSGVLGVLANEGLSEDEASFLGVVLVVERRSGAAPGSRVAVAHYLRPVVRDAAGHPRRQRPAVLAAWRPDADRWEDYSWGIVPDLAERCRMPDGEFEAERINRAAALTSTAAMLAGLAPDRSVG